MSLGSRQALIDRLRRGKAARTQFVESHLAKGIAYQIRATRDRLGWSQERLAAEVGMNQNAISRLESPDYGKPTITTLKRLAAALDVALVVRFVPFSELVDWVSGTPRVVDGLNATALAVPEFAEDSFGQEALSVPEAAVATATELQRRPPTRAGLENRLGGIDALQTDVACQKSIPMAFEQPSFPSAGMMR